MVAGMLAHTRLDKVGGSRDGRRQRRRQREEAEGGGRGRRQRKEAETALTCCLQNSETKR